jgi:thiol peroxidase
MIAPTIERTGLLEFYGKQMTILGSDLSVGQPAPAFTAHTKDWTPFDALAETAGKVRIIGSLPSFNTSVCDREARKFNEEAANLGDDAAILMVSMDLPWTLRNWCAASGVERVTTLSDHMTGDFGTHYGVLVKEARIFRRAIWVADRNGILTYAAYMPGLGAEPDYAAVLNAARAALG